MNGSPERPITLPITRAMIAKDPYRKLTSLPLHEAINHGKGGGSHHNAEMVWLLPFVAEAPFASQ